MGRTLALAGLVLFAQDVKSVYQAPDPEPTAAETLILEYMNRLRADPQAEMEIITPVIPKELGVDVAMFRREMKELQPAPPLVFNLRLLDSSRKHSHYMALHGLGHEEDSGRSGYTGKNPEDRMKAAGYEGFPGGENAFAQSSGAWHSHWGFVVDYGKGGPGGMQPGRGHRRNMMNPDFREVGTGALPRGEELSVTHNFGRRDGVRFAGGVVYRDLNGNQFYDVGEGVGGAMISSSDGGSGKNWKSGGYALELKGNDEVTVTARLGGQKYSRTFAPGSGNVKFDLAVPDPAALKKVDAVLQQISGLKDAASAKYVQTVVNLYIHAGGVSLDDVRRSKVEPLVLEVGPALEAARKAVLQALQDPETPGLKQVLDEQRKPYRATAADGWFQDAETVGKLKRGLAAFQKQAAAASPRDKKQFVAAMEQEGARLRTSAFKRDFDALLTLAKGL